VNGEEDAAAAAPAAVDADAETVVDSTPRRSYFSQVTAAEEATPAAADTAVAAIVAAFTLFAVNYLMGELFFKSKRLSKLIQGEPLMLIYKGKLIPAHLKKARISDDELEAAIREHGIEKISQVNLAVLERDGNISVLSNNFRRKTIKKRKSRQILFQDED
ncbi:MAG: hypothetical protein US77_C0006G0013, partial [Microgenomates group bacterium GW2011_GWC1_38_14]